MKVGDYVRTDTGIIEKIGNIYEQNETDNTHIQLNRMGTGKSVFILDNGKELTYSKGEVIKSSPNIIELFEEHDLVVIEYYSLRYKERVTRLFEVDYKDKEFMTIKNAYCDFMLRNNEFNDEDKKLKPIIKSIVTKEQFETMEYKVGE